VERPGVLDLGRPVDVGQGEHQAVVVPQERDGVIARLPFRVEPEILHEEGPGLLNVRDGQVEVVQDHGRHSGGSGREYSSRSFRSASVLRRSVTDTSP
jgi:hypothetical protein